MNWTREHDAWIAQRCEGLNIDENYNIVYPPGQEPAYMWGGGPEVPSYSTDISSVIQAAEAWKAQRPNNRWWGVRHEGERFAWVCESNTDSRYRSAVNFGHGDGDSVAAALAQALLLATGWPEAHSKPRTGARCNCAIEDHRDIDHGGVCVVCGGAQ